MKLTKSDKMWAYKLQLLEAQRDELLAALEEIARLSPPNLSEQFAIINEKAMAALKKAGK